MPATNWMRSWRLGSDEQGRRAQSQPGAIARAAVEGETLERLLELAAKALRTAVGADRSAVWLLPGDGGSRASGLVCGPSHTFFPHDWNHLELSAPSWKRLLNSREIVSAGRGAGSAFPNAGALADMESALWIPLRASEVVLGLAMVAYRRPHQEMDTAVLRSIGDELALAVAQRRDSGRRRHVEVEFDTRMRLLHAVQNDASPEVILAEIARASAHCARAEFVAAARRETPLNQCEGWAGEEYWRQALEIDAVARVWNAALAEARPVESPATLLPDRATPGTPRLKGVEDAPPVRLGRAVALPFGTFEGRPLGVLLAGFAAAEETSIAKQLDSYVAIASLTLEREARKSREAVLERTLEALLDSTSEWLVILEDGGSIVQASRSARLAMSLLLAPDEPTRLEDLFVPGSRQSLREWRESLWAHPAPPRPLEVLLRDGSAVRINPRTQLRHPALAAGDLENGANAVAALPGKPERARTVRRRVGKDGIGVARPSRFARQRRARVRRNGQDPRLQRSLRADRGTRSAPSGGASQF